MIYSPPSGACVPNRSSMPRSSHSRRSSAPVPGSLPRRRARTCDRTREVHHCNFTGGSI